MAIFNIIANTRNVRVRGMGQGGDGNHRKIDKKSINLKYTGVYHSRTSQEQGVGKMARYTDRSGESIDEAIVILEAKNTTDYIDAEYAYLTSKFGHNWELERHVPLGRDFRDFDVVFLKFPDGSRKKIYFDITSFPGRW